MYHFLLRRIQISAIAVKRHYWTQGDGPNYSKNMLMVGFGTVICAAVGLVSFLSCIVLYAFKECLYLTDEMSLYRALISLESPVASIVTLAYEGLLWTKYQICLYILVMLHI